jgi:hypothetical protein
MIRRLTSIAFAIGLATIGALGQGIGLETSQKNRRWQSSRILDRF